jgi:hypothetical protein
MAKKRIYKVIFHNQGKIYEVYATAVHQSAMYAFVEVEKLLFGEKSSVVLDPSEEHLKSEFKGVSRTFIPIHSIVRIDEVDKEGHGKILQATDGAQNVTPFPLYPRPDSTKG